MHFQPFSRKKNDIKCWIAPRNIKSGKNYVEEIIRGIENAKAVVLVFSKASNESKYVANEIELALRRNKPVIVFAIDPTPLQENIILQPAHYIDAYPSAENELEALVKDVYNLCYD